MTEEMRYFEMVALTWLLGYCAENSLAVSSCTVRDRRLDFYNIPWLI